MTPTTPSAPDEVVLAPCPFCGSTSHEIGYDGAGHDIQCHSWACRSKTGSWPTEADAIAAWNRRTSPQPAGVTEEPSPTDTRERVLLNDIFDFLGGVDGASELRDRILSTLKSKPTEAPVEDGWVRVPKEPTQ